MNTFTINDQVFTKKIIHSQHTEVWMNDNCIIYTKVRSWQKECMLRYAHSFPDKATNLYPGLCKVDNYYLAQRLFPFARKETLTLSKTILPTLIYARRNLQLNLNNVTEKFHIAIQQGFEFWQYLTSIGKFFTLDCSFLNFMQDKNGNVFWIDPVF